MPGKAAANFASLAVNYWAAFAAGYKDAMSAFNIESIDLIHDNDAVCELSQVRGLPTQGVNMLVSTVVSAGYTQWSRSSASRTRSITSAAGRCRTGSRLPTLVSFSSPMRRPTRFRPHTNPPRFCSSRLAVRARSSMQGSGDADRRLSQRRPHEGGCRVSRYRDCRRPAWRLAAGKSRQVMLSMVTAYPDMKGVFAQNDDEAIGALSVLQERSDLSHVKLASVDGVPQAVEEVAKGGSFVATNLALPPLWRGLPPPCCSTGSMAGKRPARTSDLHGSPTATAENAGKIYQDIYKAEKLPFDWVKMSRTLSPDNWDPQNKIIPIDPKEHWKGAKGEEKLNAAYNAADWPERPRSRKCTLTTISPGCSMPPNAAVADRPEVSPDGRVAPPALELRDISKSYPGTKALSSVTFTLQRFGLFGLVGENGAGKSTLLSIINGTVKPDRRSIAINGEHVGFGHRSDAARHGIATVFQEQGLIPSLPVYENIFLGPGRQLFSGRVPEPAHNDQDRATGA